MSAVPQRDPFGASSGSRRPSWPLVLVGALVLVGGVLWAALSVGLSVEGAGSLEDGRVAEGVVTEEQPAQLSFRATSQEYTVYLRTEGVGEAEENNRNATVASIGCSARLPDGTSHDFSGSRQGSSVVLGDAASIGWFTAPAGQVTLSCGYTDRSRFAEQRRDDDAQLFVAAGKPAGSGWVLGIVGGVFLAVGGGLLLARGTLRRRDPG